MNNTILPYGLFLFIALFIYYGAYAIPYEKKHKPPEETSRWIFWVDVVLVKGILVILIIAFPGSQKSTAGAFKYMIVGNVTYGIGYSILLFKFTVEFVIVIYDDPAPKANR